MTNLGYGDGLVLRQTIRNNHATSNIARGQIVDLVGSVGTSGVGDEVMLGTVATAADSPAALGVAETDINANGTTGEGDWGHIIVFGKAEVLTSALLIAANDAIAIDASGVIDQATAAQVNASAGIGKALETNGTAAVLIACFVNFLNRDTAASSGYAGVETP